MVPRLSLGAPFHSNTAGTQELKVTWMLPSHFALMEAQGSKRKRAYPFEPNMAVLANFPHKFLAHLLPALIKVGKLRSCRGNKDKEVEKIVWFQVNMALAASASGFAWSRALRQRLERGMKVKRFPSIMARQLAVSNLSSTCKQKNAFNMEEAWALPVIPRPLVPIIPQVNAKPNLSMYKARKPRRAQWTSSRKRKLPGEDEKLHGRMRTLRRILPGGSEMGVVELLSEVGNYMVCLELQVNILRSLLRSQ